ncbi:hypothetical protein TrCOL_g9660 [Triparma columacea]|uniref:Cyclic nucleotide-binding domain-containing protein n=1 Tax=Triparma columacea TaxID=722753 RepID=A0A9W7LF21_9STRA|nr:hypothetical protein TrCOL_g9660 [Triparma columacea]
MGSIGSSFSGEDESPSTPKFKGGNSPERLSPIPSGKGMSPREDHKGNNLKESRSESVIDKAEEKKHLTVMEPFGKRITHKTEPFIAPPNSNNPKPNNNIRTRSRRTESVDSYENPYEDSNGRRRAIGVNNNKLPRSGMMSYSQVQRILSIFKPSTRTPLLCEKIVKYLDQSTLVKIEPWHMILSTSQKKSFYRTLQYRKIVDDHGLHFEMNLTSKNNYYILLRGSCSVTLPGGKNFNLRAGDTFGGLQMPPNLEQYAVDVKARGSYKSRETLSEIMFAKTIGGRKGRVGRGDKINVTVPKGGELAVLSSNDVKEILEKMSLKLSISSLLTTLGLRCMEGKFKVQKFKAGAVLQTEGATVKRVFAIISGECTCVKKTAVVPETDTNGKEGGSIATGGASFAESGVNFDKRTGERKVQLKKIVLRSGFTSNASTSKLMLYGPKSIVGDVDTLLGTNAETTVVCNSDVMCVGFDAEDFRERLGNYTDLKNQFVKLARIRRSLVATQLARALGYVEMGEGVDWDKEVKEGGERIRRVWREEREREQRVMKRMMEEEMAEPDDTSAYSDSYDNDGASITERSSKSSFRGGERVFGVGVKAARLNQRSVDHRSSRGSPVKGSFYAEDDKEEKEEKKEEKGIWVDRLANSAVFPPENLDLGPPEITFEMVFQRRVKKNPRVNRSKLMIEFKRLLLDETKNDGPIEYEEPKDRFERLDYIDTSGYKYSDTVLTFLPHKGESNGDTYDLSLLTPFPTLTRARKLHGKPLPVLPHTTGFLNPAQAFWEVRQREAKRADKREWSVGKSDKATIKKALEDGFYPHFKESGLSIITRPSTVAGSVAGSSVYGGSSYGKGAGLMGSGLGQGSSLLTGSYGSYVEGKGRGGLGPSVWASNEDKLRKLYGDDKEMGFYDITKRSRPRSKLVGGGGKR